MARRRSESDPGPPIQVIERLGRILALFAEGPPEVSVRQVAAELDVSRPSVHRYLRALVALGFLESTGPGRYRLGPLLVQLANRALGSLEILDRAGRYMRRLAEEAQETVVMSFWAGHGPVVVRVQECTTKLVGITVRVGAALPLNSAQGRVFLAYLPDPFLVKELLARLSPGERTELEASLDEVRRTGIAVYSRVVAGIRTVAVPVFDRHGVIAATLAVVGTTAAIPEDPESGLARALREAAAELSRELGYPFEPHPELGRGEAH